MVKIQRETIKAMDVKEGDEIWFPNSRHAQKVTSIDNDEGAMVATLHAEEAQWQCPYEHEVDRKVPDGGE